MNGNRPKARPARTGVRALPFRPRWQGHRRRVSPVLGLAEQIVQTADREHPADAVLRQELKAHRSLSPEEATQVSKLVFGYYRWRGWLEQKGPLRAQLDAAQKLAERFAEEPQGFAAEELMARAVPKWVASELEVTPDWARALQAEPKLWLRARRGQGRDIAEALGNCRTFGRGPLGDTLEYHGTEDLFHTPEFQRGDFELQDLSSQAVGWLCAPGPGQTWWDACAGEGGKLLHLSELMENKGLIWASDRALWRLQKLKRRTARARAFNYRTAPWDGGERLPTRTRFDGILIDAPCSGVGTWQRNPHARWTLRRDDVRELAALQGQLLQHAATALKPGGKLIYSVCTLTRAETTAVAEAFERAFPKFERLALPNPLQPEAPPAAQQVFWPQQFGGNGMFVVGWTWRG